MYTFLYNYVFIPLTVCASAAVPLLICYATKPEQTKKVVFNTSWKITKTYFEVKDFVLDIYDSITYTENGYDADDEGGYDSNSDEEVNNRIIKNLINIDKNNNIYINDIEKYKNIEKYDSTLIFIKETSENVNKYKRIENLSEDIITTEIKRYNNTPFIQVEYVDDSLDLRISIHKQLEEFYIEGNKLLDKTFIKWFMAYFYNTTINDNYIIQCFDKNVNMFELSNNDYITLFDSDKNEYKITRGEDIILSSNQTDSFISNSLTSNNIKEGNDNSEQENEISQQENEISEQKNDNTTETVSKVTDDENLISFSDQESDGCSSSS